MGLVQHKIQTSERKCIYKTIQRNISITNKKYFICYEKTIDNY